MTLAVVDASVMTSFYVLDVDDPRRAIVTERLSIGGALYAPAHFDAEVASALRGLARRNAEVERLGSRALRHLATTPIRRVPLAPLLERIWELRENVTPYDAAYVALAERLDGTLITSDSRLAAATGPRCTVDLIS